MVASLRSIVVTLAIVGLLAACTSAPAPTPTTASSKPAAASSPTVGAEKPAGAPSAAPAKASPSTDWKAEWDKTLAAAKQEGKVVLYGPPGADTRPVLTDEFQKAYGIPVEFWGVANGGQLAARVTNERQSGQYVNDLFIYGSTTLWGPLKAAMAPFEGNLVQPEVADRQNWRYWQFADTEEKSIFSMLLGVDNMAVINTSIVKPEEVKSLNSLVDPKYKGKIVLADPRIAGQGAYSLSGIYSVMGEPFLARLLKEQQPTVSGNVEQIADWVVHGRFPIALSAGDTLIQPYVKQGMPIEGIQMFNEGGYWAPGYWNVALADHRPHPNAAKIYLNWLLSKDTQEKISLIAGKPSARADVQADKLPKASVPVAGAQYWAPHLEKNAPVLNKVNDMFDEVFGK